MSFSMFELILKKNRFNRTLRQLLEPELLIKGNRKWIEILDEALEKYNNRKHRTLKMSPKEALKESNVQLLKNKVYRNIKKYVRAKFKIGDFVRISRHKDLFEKKTGANWSFEVFKIRKVCLSNPRTYLLEDFSGEPIEGRFIEPELRSTRYPHDYLLEKIIRRKGNRAYVKWLGFKEPSWIPMKNVH